MKATAGKPGLLGVRKNQGAPSARLCLRGHSGTAVNMLKPALHRQTAAGGARTSDRSRPVRGASTLCHVRPPTPRTTCSRPCAPGLCLAHTAGPPGPFRGRQNHQPPLTRRESMDSERVLLKMPVSGTRQVPPALMASWTRAPGTGGPRRPAPPRPCLRLARVCPLLPGSRLLPQRSTALCLRPVLHVVLSLLGKQAQGSKVNSRKKAEPAAVLPSLSPICPFLRPSKGRHFPVART